MARKPNYDFERREREKARALKKAERQRLKQEKAEQRKEGALGDQPLAPDAETESGAATTPSQELRG